MPAVDIKLVAVLVAAIINMVVGFLWYSPVLFAKPWMNLVGKRMEELQANAPLGYALTFVGALVQAYILAHFVQYIGATDIKEGLEAGWWIWLGFTGITMGVNYIFAGRNWKLWAIDSGYFLVVLLINGALLASWY
jgi:hypothetical protein